MTCAFHHCVECCGLGCDLTGTRLNSWHTQKMPPAQDFYCQAKLPVGRAEHHGGKEELATRASPELSPEALSHSHMHDFDDKEGKAKPKQKLSTGMTSHSHIHDAADREDNAKAKQKLSIGVTSHSHMHDSRSKPKQKLFPEALPLTRVHSTICQYSSMLSWLLLFCFVLVARSCCFGRKNTQKSHW